MNLLLRFLKTMLVSIWRRHIGPLDESVIHLRVWPNDLDLNLHMNNGRYLSIMDLGRLDLLARMGVAVPAMRRRWIPLVGSAAIRFLRSLDPFEAYELHSRILCWDEKWFYMEQRFERGDVTAAIGVVKGLLRGPDGNIRPLEVLGLIGAAIESPPMPEWIALWQRGETMG
jgi:acyl-CoA thioesterase FadM